MIQSGGTTTSPDGALGMDRTCDLRFRKPRNVVDFDLTGF